MPSTADKTSGSIMTSGKLLLKIVSILEEEKVDILDSYYEAYCEHISKIDKKKRSADELKLICTPVKHRFGSILERFMGVLRSQTGEYDLKESEQDEEYALRFVVPGRYKELDSHYVIEMTQYFYDIVTSRVLNKLKLKEYSTSRERVSNLMHGLIYITFEDLWVSSVVAFRSQHSLIQQLLCKLMMTQEEERQNLWREIHDELLQVLGVVQIKLEIVERLSQIDPGAMKRELNLIKAITKKTIQEIRDLGHGFNLFWVERKGFVFSLRRFVKLFEQEFRIRITLGLCPRVKTINKFPAVTLFRIIQEGLYNIGKHSRASRAKVNITVLDKEIVATIEDNGMGFDVKQVKRKSARLRHLGLVFMRERTKILGGALEIKSTKGSGTRIKVNVPIQTFCKMSVTDGRVTDVVSGKRRQV
jgi:signal transduction histidine kinase